MFPIGQVVHNLMQTAFTSGGRRIGSLQSADRGAAVPEKLTQNIEDATAKCFRSSSIFSRRRLYTSPSRVSSASRFHK